MPRLVRTEMGKRQRKPGLWFSAMKVEVEDVTKAHKKPCNSCGVLPGIRRLKIVRGSGRHQVMEVRCMGCGVKWLRDMREAAKRASRYLLTGKGEIRK